MAKSIHFLFGCYSLSLDGLSQEAGALLRPLIENYELLVYFRLDMSRIIQVTENNLPSAGEIGRMIQGNFKDLREHLNINASHFGYKLDSVRHLFDENAVILPLPNHTINVLYYNLQLVNALQVIILSEAKNYLNDIEYISDSLFDNLANWNQSSIKVFTLNNIFG